MARSAKSCSQNQTPNPDHSFSPPGTAVWCGIIPEQESRVWCHSERQLYMSWWPNISTNSKASGIQFSKPVSLCVCVFQVWYFQIFWLPTTVNYPVPRQCFPCVRDSLCTYLFMWGQFYTIPDCGQEHQLLGSTEVCSTHLGLVWLFLCYFRLVNSSEALPDCLTDAQVTLFLF